MKLGIRNGHTGLMTSKRCLRPGCDARIVFGPASSPAFCGDTCRMSATRDLRWLLSEVRRLNTEVQRAASAAEAQEVRSRLRLILWHLRSFSPIVATDEWLMSVAESAG